MGTLRIATEAERSKTRLCALCASVIAVLLATMAHAQVRETATVEVVEVPVYVTARNAPVGGLTRDNFQLFINGTPQAIDYFDVTDYATLTESHDVRQRRLYMLVFDLLSPANDLHHAQRAALEFVDHALPSDTIGVATYNAGGLKIIVPFTHDHAIADRAVAALDFPALNDPLHLSLSAAERGEISGGRFHDPRFDPALLDPRITLAALADDEVASLTDLADRLAGMEGQKHVVLLSAGFEGVLLHGLESPRAPGDIRSMSLIPRETRGRLPMLNMDLVRHIEGLNRAFAAAGVFLDAIDIGGLRPFQTFADNESLYALVRDTGGEVIDHRNDLPSALRLLADTHRVVYNLGFSAHDTGRSENRITVRLVNVPRGTQALYRHSYTAGAGEGDTGDMLRLADIIQNDIPQNGVTTNVIATSSGNAATVELELPGRELLAHEVAGFIGAKVMMYVMSGASVVAFKIKRIDIDVSRAEAGLQDGAPVRVSDTFDLPPGHYAAKVVVRMDATGALGFARADVTVTP